MTVAGTLYNRYKRYQTLRTDEIRALPILILMPHSSCNCRCVMCDIWKDNKNLRQLTENDIKSLLRSLKHLETQKLVMSGGEALLNPNFFRFCEIIKKEGIKISLLSTGLGIKRHAVQILDYVDDLIISLDGDEKIHDQVRNTPGAFSKLSEGVQYIKNTRPSFPIKARSVIQRMNFRFWKNIIESAKTSGFDQVSFLPADVSSHAFNREVLWTEPKKHEIIPDESELILLKEIIENIIDEYAADFRSGFIAEAPGKFRNIYNYYSAFYGLNPFPYKKCNAPWVSAVIEPDGNVRPCFFHPPQGNIREQSLSSILNSDQSIRFRKNLDVETNPVCVKCVCSLNLSPGVKLK